MDLGIRRHEKGPLNASITFRLCSHYTGYYLLYSMNIYPICDSISEIGAAQIRSITEIAPKSPFLYAKEKALYGMVFEQAQKHLV